MLVQRLHLHSSLSSPYLFGCNENRTPHWSSAFVLPFRIRNSKHNSQQKRQFVTMQRQHTNEQKLFSATTDTYVEQLQASLRQRREEMNEAWENVDSGWQDLAQCIREKGIVKPAIGNGEVLRLNVGGSHVNINRSVLSNDTMKKSQSGGALLDLFESMWDERLPRDADDRVVLDESPACVKFLLHALLKGSEKNKTFGSFDKSSLPDDERWGISYISQIIGLAHPALAFVKGGSKVVDSMDLGALHAICMKGCPHGFGGLELLFRGSRGGMNAAAFHAHCTNDTAQTLTLIRVALLGSSSYSIVGGFSDVSWGEPPTWRHSEPQWISSRGAFIFMLKNGHMTTGSVSSSPQIWNVKEGQERYAVLRNPHDGPSFGDSDLLVKFSENGCTVRTGSAIYDVRNDSAFLALNGRPVTEIEVFRVCTQAAVQLPTSSNLNARSAIDVAPDPETMRSVETEDTKNFGAAIAASFMEETMALHTAKGELLQAQQRVAASALALSHVYGPHIASGANDGVVELSVRGTRMTTLRSTLQACPDSALAARFDEEKWPAHEKEVDERGWRKIDCPPKTFSKILDILRTRKRAGWTESKEGGDKRNDPQPVRVMVGAQQCASFSEFVAMYFPGCESFMLDLAVLPSASSKHIQVRLKTAR